MEPQAEPDPLNTTIDTANRQLNVVRLGDAGERTAQCHEGRTTRISGAWHRDLEMALSTVRTTEVTFPSDVECDLEGTLKGAARRNVGHGTVKLTKAMVARRCPTRSWHRRLSQPSATVPFRIVLRDSGYFRHGPCASELVAVGSAPAAISPNLAYFAATCEHNAKTSSSCGPGERWNCGLAQLDQS